MIATATITGLALVICIYSIFVGPRTVFKSKLIRPDTVCLNKSWPANKILESWKAKIKTKVKVLTIWFKSHMTNFNFVIHNRFRNHNKCNIWKIFIIPSHYKWLIKGLHRRTHRPTRICTQVLREICFSLASQMDYFSYVFIIHCQVQMSNVLIIIRTGISFCEKLIDKTKIKTERFLLWLHPVVFRGKNDEDKNVFEFRGIQNWIPWSSSGYWRHFWAILPSWVQERHKWQRKLKQ